MEIPKIPQALVGSIVLSHRDIGPGGRIQRIEADSDRPFVLWEGNDIPIATEWQHIDAIDVKPYAAAIGMSAGELQAEILALMKKNEQHWPSPDLRAKVKPSKGFKKK